MQLSLSSPETERRAISPFRELGAYELLWQQPKASFKSMAEQFAAHPTAVPSDFVNPEDADRAANTVLLKFQQTKLKNFGVRVHGGAEYPEKLRDARHPVELLYYCGWWELVFSRCVAVVGTRKPSVEGQARTHKLVRALVADDYTIVSGLAEGIDTIAHRTALKEKGRTVAVIGTPLSDSYPRHNAELQRLISEHFLVISQVPVLRYESQDYRLNRFFFPERNKTMSALTKATIIVEAGETSGTLTQAKAAIEQGRKLFILDSCFRNPALTWPQRLAKRGAIRVRSYDDIRNALSE